MRTDLFDYDLPVELIAQRPLERRDASRLMKVDRGTGDVSHHRFGDLPSMLSAGDCLVVNDTRVIRGRLEARKKGTGGAVELLLLERVSEGVWRALAGGASLRRGAELELEGGGIAAEIVNGPTGGKVVVSFSREIPGEGEVDSEVLERGKLPLPPYIHGELREPERYQTVYSRRELSAAAPTAGLHFTGELLDEIRGMGVEFASLELAVGLDTFTPVREEKVEDHHMHTEWFDVTPDCARVVNGCEGRVIAVGTTSVRALESAATDEDGQRVHAAARRTDLFITPGYSFRAVDALVTNFHFPRSTLLMLVCAFGGYDLVMSAYREAVSERYRFYSFGDAMILT